MGILAFTQSASSCVSVNTPCHDTGAPWGVILILGVALVALITLLNVMRHR